MLQNTTTSPTGIIEFSPLITSQICGFSIILISILGLLPYSMFIWIVFTKKKLKKSFFTLAGSLGIADCICLVLMITYAGPCTILQKSLSDTKVLGFLLAVGWFTGLVLILFLSFDRYLCICHNQHYARIFAMKNTYLFCIGSWLFGIVYSVSTLFDCCPLQYTFELMTWSWDVTKFGAVVLTYGELGMVIFTISVTYTLNGLVIRKVRVMQRSIGSLGAAHDLQKTIREKKIFIQFLITTIWLIIVDVPFIAFGYVPNPSFWFGYFVTVVYTINCSINGWVYMFMNSVIKREFKSIYRRNRSDVNLESASGQT